MLTKKEVLHQLFKHEHKVLEEGKKISCHSNDTNGTLMPHYQKLLEHYEQLLNLSMKFTSISDNQFTRLLDREQPNPHLEFLSYRDSLTSLYNRSYVNKILPSLVASPEEPLSCLYVDMNGLKLTNDVFGHQIGDEMIRTMSHILTTSCSREQDVIVRWGGDEFLILLPNTTSSESEQLKGKIKNCFQKHKDLPIQLSAAIGIATTEQINGDLNNLLQLAEQQMYKEKFLANPGVRQKIINELRRSLKLKCPIMHNHLKRVVKMAVAFALELNVHPRSLEMEKLKLLAYLHDIGAIVMSKERIYNSLESSAFWKMVRDGGEYGYRVAQALGENTVAYGIIGIHEHWDGTGFPYGLKKEEIPYLSRIITIVDTYDILLHGMANSQPLTKEEALKKMLKNEGKKFDPKLINIFVHHFNKN